MRSRLWRLSKKDSYETHYMDCHSRLSHVDGVWR